MTKRQPFEGHWERIIAHFAFEKVQKTMECLKWRWAMAEDMGVPSVGEIVNTARELCQTAYEKKSTWATGGFEAEYVPENDSITLKFIVDYQSSENTE